MEPFETFEHEGVTVEIHYDDTAENPFDIFDTLAEIVWTEREHAYKNVGGHVSLDYEHFLDMDRFISAAHARRYLTLMERYLVAIPFDLADYGSNGMRASLAADDDERISGFIVVSEKNREKVGAPLERLEENALGDWREWKAWVEGDVYGYIARVPGGDDDEYESCWGFYGNVEDVRKEATDAAEWLAHDHWANAEPQDIAEVLAGHTA